MELRRQGKSRHNSNDAGCRSGGKMFGGPPRRDSPELKTKPNRLVFSRTEAGGLGTAVVSPSSSTPAYNIRYRDCSNMGHS
jgi:hypothetical protein